MMLSLLSGKFQRPILAKSCRLRHDPEPAGMGRIPVVGTEAIRERMDWLTGRRLRSTALASKPIPGPLAAPLAPGYNAPLA